MRDAGAAQSGEMKLVGVVMGYTPPKKSLGVVWNFRGPVLS
jgi:hypothetical protein